MNDRIVLISGATGGLGRVTAQQFGLAGHSLALLGRDQKRLGDLERTLGLPPDRIFTHTVELTDAYATRAAAVKIRSRFGAVHVLVHLVGGWVGGKSLVDTTADDFENMLSQHGRSTFNLLNAFGPDLIKSGWGRILVVSSPSATQPAGMNGAYAAGKAAEESLILTMAEELRNTRVTANIIQVKVIDVAHKREGTTPEEIVAAMRYLCSEEGGKVNGARIPLF